MRIKYFIKKAASFILAATMMVSVGFTAMAETINKETFMEELEKAASNTMTEAFGEGYAADIEKHEEVKSLFSGSLNYDVTLMPLGAKYTGCYANVKGSNNKEDGVFDITFTYVNEMGMAPESISATVKYDENNVTVDIPGYLEKPISIEKDENKITVDAPDFMEEPYTTEITEAEKEMYEEKNLFSNIEYSVEEDPDDSDCKDYTITIPWDDVNELLDLLLEHADDYTNENSEMNIDETIMQLKNAVNQLNSIKGSDPKLCYHVKNEKLTGYDFGIHLHIGNEINQSIAAGVKLTTGLPEEMKDSYTDYSTARGLAASVNVENGEEKMDGIVNILFGNGEKADGTRRYDFIAKAEGSEFGFTTEKTDNTTDITLVADDENVFSAHGMNQKVSPEEISGVYNVTLDSEKFSLAYKITAIK